MHQAIGPYLSLSSMYLDDDNLALLYREHPKLQQWDATQGCPTCDGAGRYYLKGYSHPCYCQDQRTLFKIYANANIGELYMRLDWDDFEGSTTAKTMVVKWLTGHKMNVKHGLGLTMYGDLGTGKTMLSSLLAKAGVRLGYSVLFCTFAEMISLFTEGWYSPKSKADFERKLVKSDILVLDDIGKEFKSTNNLAESTFDHLLRRRVINLRPTIITTNLSIDKLRKGYGESIFSLMSERSLNHEFEGADWREQATLRTFDEISKGEVRPIV